MASSAVVVRGADALRCFVLIHPFIWPTKLVVFAVRINSACWGFYTGVGINVVYIISEWWKNCLRILRIVAALSIEFEYFIVPVGRIPVSKFLRKGSITDAPQWNTLPVKFIRDVVVAIGIHAASKITRFHVRSIPTILGWIVDNKIGFIAIQDTERPRRHENRDQ